ncbi:hypothetical protein [Tenacibaculum amylolyticum]|uniref:hypothetical protein n=1 Tax=Tenacibaculum amylolyticum TaxID=104269 RepID=UPI003894E001
MSNTEKRLKVTNNIGFIRYSFVVVLKEDNSLTVETEKGKPLEQFRGYYSFNNETDLIIMSISNPTENSDEGPKDSSTLYQGSMHEGKFSGPCVGANAQQTGLTNFTWTAEYINIPASVV